MKKFFAQLRPMERRLAVGVLVVLIVVLNAIFVWPRFSDWGKLKGRLNNARATLAQYQTAIADTAKYQSLVNTFEGQGQFVAPEDQAINFLRTVQVQASASGFGIANRGYPSTRGDQFFSELSQSINVSATDAQLIDFLYKLGNDRSMIRVRDLELQPDVPHQHLNANISLIASYQKKPVAAAPANATTPAAAASATTTTSAPKTVSAPKTAPVSMPNSKPVNAKSK